MWNSGFQTQLLGILKFLRSLSSVRRPLVHSATTEGSFALFELRIFPSIHLKILCNAYLLQPELKAGKECCKTAFRILGGLKKRQTLSGSPFCGRQVIFANIASAELLAVFHVLPRSMEYLLMSRIRGLLFLLLLSEIPFTWRLGRPRECGSSTGVARGCTSAVLLLAWTPKSFSRGG